MERSLLHGISQQDMQAFLDSFESAFNYPRFFPLEFTPSLTWQSLRGKSGVPVAADVVAFDATSREKTREVVRKAYGDIPKIEIKRGLKEKELNEYQQLLEYANTRSGAEALLDFVYGDVEFVWNGVNARLEWLAMQAASKGRITLTGDNNIGLVTETDVTFNIPDLNKIGSYDNVFDTKKKWNEASAKPLSQIRTIVKAARKQGVILRYIFMDSGTFDVFVSNEEVVALAAAWLNRALQLTQTPVLEEVNIALRNANLPEIVIVDSIVSVESKTGVITPTETWDKGKVTFVTDLQFGSTMYAPLAAEMIESPSTKAKRSHVLIEKWGQVEPVAEWTKGSANAFPVINDPDSVFILDAYHKGWETDSI